MTGLSAYRASVVALFAAWIVCLGLSLDDVLRHTADSPIIVVPAESSDDYPTVATLKAGLDAGGPDLAPGDRLLALADTDLQGAGSPEWVSALARFRGRDVEVPVTISRGGGVQTIRMRAASHFGWWPRLLASLVFAGCALFFLVRLRQSDIVRALVVSNLAVACWLAGHFSGSLLETRASIAAQELSIALMKPLPGAPATSSMLDHRPLAFSDNGQPGAVDDEMDGLVGRDEMQIDTEALTVPRKGGVVGRFESETHQGQHCPQESLRLAKR